MELCECFLALLRSIFLMAGVALQNPTDKNIYNAIEGWLHCQRDPEHQGLPPGVPRALISESDFTDPFRKDGGGVVIPEGIPKQYDFLYVNQVRSGEDGKMHSP